MLRTRLRGLLVPMLIATTSVCAQQPGSPTPAASPPAAVYVRPSPPGELVDIGGRRLHVECKGPTTGPTVVFEAGLSQFTARSTYGKAQELIASFAHVCVYDRAGLGWSDAAPGPRTHDDMVNDLHRLLAAKRHAGPIVLVGHSIGGLLARLYAMRHPTDVAGVVLVDATAEAGVFTPSAAEERTGLIARMDAGLRIAKPGAPVVAMPVGTSPEVMLAFTPEVIASVKQEYEAIDRVPEAMRGATGYGTLGSTPLTVIRRGRTATPPNAEDVRWRTLQEALPALSSRSRLLVATEAGHVIPYDQPTIVADAVRQLLSPTRTP
jgi:pimeloyl-ACP methyl ester carboxylesterase